jgi:hypothetical protein
LAKADTAASATDMATAVEKATAALKQATEIGRAHADLAKVTQEILSLKRANDLAPKRERSERLRDYVAILAPVVAVITLAATIFAQTWQFLRSERSKQEDALNTRWQDAVKAISASGTLSPAIASLQPFLRSPAYAAQARELAINLLANSSDPLFFTSLFGPTFSPLTWSNLDDVVRLDRALRARLMPLLQKSWNGTSTDMSQLTKDETATFFYIASVNPTIAVQIGNLLKTPRPPGTQLDLSGTHFENADWQGVNLDAVNLDYAVLRAINIRNVDLTKVTKFNSADFYATAWWEAKAINRSLFDYLQANFPYSEQKYQFPPGQQPLGFRADVFKQAVYDAEIKRLTSQLK